MIVIIAGSRHITDMAILVEAIKASGFEITCVVSGCGRGVDELGERWAAYNSISIKRFSADWEEYGKAAGPIRNAEMAEVADALIAIPGPESRGTLNMIGVASARGLKVYVHGWR